MNDRADSPGAGIGSRLRELRASRGLSLRQLARSIGASPSLLSQVENGKVTPSVDTLYQLARALEVPIAEFFGPPPTPDPARAGGAWVVRRADRQRITLEGGVTWDNLLPGDEPGRRWMEIGYPPGASSGEHLLRHAGQDLFLVLEGELTFLVGFAEHRLGAGDSIGFGDGEPHLVRNDGAVAARAIVLVTGDTEGRSPGRA